MVKPTKSVSLFCALISEEKELQRAVNLLSSDLSLRVKTNPCFFLHWAFLFIQGKKLLLLVEFGILSLAACPSTTSKAELNRLNQINSLLSPAQVAEITRTARE